MKKKDKALENSDPIHKKFGVLSNIAYVWKKMMSAKLGILRNTIIIVLCAPIMNYLWTFINKFVIDMITGKSGIEALALLIAAVFFVQASSTILNDYGYAGGVWLVHLRFLEKVKLNAQMMSIDFQDSEDYDVRNSFQKAGRAFSGEWEGFEGMMRQLTALLATLASMAVGFAIMGTLNVFLLLIMAVMVLINFLVSNKCDAQCKIKVWDPLSPFWRKLYYMEEISRDFGSAKDIRLFNMKDWLLGKYNEICKIHLNAHTTNAKIWFVASIVNQVLWVLIQLSVYGWLFYMVINGEMTIGNFSMYLASAVTLYSSLSDFGQRAKALFSCSRSIDDLRSFEVYAQSRVNDGGKELAPQQKYEFEFKNVSFKYPKSERYALKNLSLKLNAGERLAIVGLNGSGKSTFVKLLMRLYEPTEGEILLNGVNVSEYSKKSYYAIFAPVFQQTKLFAFPLCENISMSAPEETDKALAEKCLIEAGFGEKLNSLPNGIDTEVLKIAYDDGVDFSGGEQQKLALSRALYKKAPVVILDEPTAALDALAERKQYSDFDKLVGGKTTIYISHRLSSTQFCNNIALFKEGELVEYGTHKSLLEKGGDYAEMFRVQAQYYVENDERNGSEVTANA